MRVDRNGYDPDRSVVRGCGRGAVAGGGVFRRRRGHCSQAAHGGSLGPRDDRGGRVIAFARLLRWLLRARAGVASDARERRGPRH